MKSQSFGVALVLLLGFAAMPCHAQVQRSGGGEVQKFMQQYQQLSAEKISLQGQLAQMKKDLDAAKTELDAVKKQRDALKAHAGGVSPSAVAQLQSAKASADKELEQSKQRITEIVGRFRDLGSNLKEVEADRTKLRRDLDNRNSEYDRCASNNLQLYEVTGDVLKRYENVGPLTKVAAAEPFTRLTRTRIENLVDEYRARAEELRSKSRPAAATTAPAAGAGTAGAAGNTGAAGSAAAPATSNGPKK